MKSHEELEASVRRHAVAPKVDGSAPDVRPALAQPKAASVQAMLDVQRLAGNAGAAHLLARDEDRGAGSPQRSPVLDVVGKGGGQPLETGLRRDMESRLGADFSDVRLHTDSRATSSAKAVQANAYTVGNEVVVRGDRFAPHTDQGKETMAHELTHVIQQRHGPVDGTSTGDGISVSDPGDKFERAAETNATRAMAGTAPAAAASAQLQREAAPDDEEAQMQREAAPDDEEAQMQREAAPDDEEAQMQREAAPDDEELQGQWTAQRRRADAR